MLQSKYLTKEGMEMMLKALYKSGWRYIFRRGHSDEFYVSKKEPRYSDNDMLIFCSEHQARLGNAIIALITDVMKGYNYITIADHIDTVGWSTVEVDTPVLVKAVEDGQWTRRYFAGYHDGHVYTWDGGATSWSTDSKENISWWQYAKLSED